MNIYRYLILHIFFEKLLISRWIVCGLISLLLHVLGIVTITLLAHKATGAARSNGTKTEISLRFVSNFEASNNPTLRGSQDIQLNQQLYEAFIKNHKPTVAISKSAHMLTGSLNKTKNLEDTQVSYVSQLDQNISKYYFDASQVDQAALPLDDWNFNFDSLNPAFNYVLQLKIYIDSDGRVDEWEITKQEPEGDWANQVTEKLKSTILVPATKDGISVNMVRIIEVYIKP